MDPLGPAWGSLRPSGPTYWVLGSDKAIFGRGRSIGFGLEGIPTINKNNYINFFIKINCGSKQVRNHQKQSGVLSFQVSVHFKGQAILGQKCRSWKSTGLRFGHNFPLFTFTLPVQPTSVCGQGECRARGARGARTEIPCVFR